MDWWYDFLSRHPQIMASKPDWLMRGKVNDQYIKDVQSGQLKCTKFRRALLSAIQYIQTLNDASVLDGGGFSGSNGATSSFSELFSLANGGTSLKSKSATNKSSKGVKTSKAKESKTQTKLLKNGIGGADDLSKIMPKVEPTSIYE